MSTHRRVFVLGTLEKSSQNNIYNGTQQSFIHWTDGEVKLRLTLESKTKKNNKKSARNVD